MKHFRLIAGTTLFLFIIGLLSGSLVVKLTEKILGRTFIGLSILSSFTPQLSFGFLLAFCSICAGCFLWAYLQYRAVNNPKLVFGLGLLISITSAVIGTVLKLIQLRLAFDSFGNQVKNDVLSAGTINYFSWGFSLTFFVNVVIIVFLLLVSRQKQQQKDNNMSIGSN